MEQDGFNNHGNVTVTFPFDFISNSQLDKWIKVYKERDANKLIDLVNELLEVYKLSYDFKITNGRGGPWDIKDWGKVTLENHIFYAGDREKFTSLINAE